ncbi:MAG: glycosyltransferase family 39 protein [Nitrospinae bacterium]|nr:glycosyltransferase family 39 protein [Nitrospinota bacterium]
MKKIKLSYPHLILVSLSLFLIVNNIIWLKHDTLPPIWDQAGHLTKSYDYFKAIEHLDSNILYKLLTLTNFYPPLFYISSYPFYKILGMSGDSGCLTNSIFLILLIFSTYGIANTLYGKRAGILSALLASTYNVVSTHSRQYLLEISLISMVTLAIYFLLKSNDFKEKRYSIAFGIAAGIGMLTRWNFLFFVFPVIIYTIYKILKTVGSQQSTVRSQIKNLIIASLFFIIILSPWYIANTGNILLNASISIKDSAVIEGDPHGLNIENFIYYLKTINEQVSSPLYLLFIIGFALYIYRYRENRDMSIFWWFIGSYLIVTAVANKDSRYSMHYLPAVAIFSTFWIKDIKSVIVKNGLSVIIITFVLLQYLSSTYGLRLFSVERTSLGPFNFILLQKNPPIKEDWRVDEIEKVILAENRFYNTKNMVRIIPDYPTFAKATFEYYKYFNNYDNIHFSWHTNFPDFTDYIVTKTGNVGPLFREKAHILTKYIEEAPHQFTNIFRKFREFSLPDGSTATLYKRDIVPLSGVTAQDVIHMIKERLETILLQFVKDHEGLEIQIIPYGDEETLRGRFKEINILAKKAMIGDYKHKDAGMMVNDIKFTFHDITVNLYELKNGNVQVISLKDVIPSGKIYAEDLREFAAKEAKGIKHIDIHFNKNTIHLSADLNSYANLRVKLRPIVTPENNISIKVEGLNMLSLPIPSFILNILMHNVYVFKQDITPCRVVLNNIKIENEYLRIN